ncbi:hypothetical protein B4099_1976 [Heyndrickxia coagulans]|uniref:Uncharacterized protein n=1 Tax=Heyndrickxia coagulans TaxID=1398 RepID=A0A150KIA9_HEYCO|nr:hypothetical protein B4099_1976 [Heyndrickxia coagulans]
MRIIVVIFLGCFFQLAFLFFQNDPFIQFIDDIRFLKRVIRE